MKYRNSKCQYCKSENVTVLNTYKHLALVCADCGNVSHIKKEKYLFEYIVPRSFAKRVLPQKGFLRLFSDQGDFVAAEFYDTDAFGLMDQTGWRQSEVQQVLDQLDLVDFDPKGKRILDVSGGPGMIGDELSSRGADVVVTEYAQSQVAAMNQNLSVTALKFDYLNDDIATVASGEYDLIMVRSSIIFCADLDGFVSALSKLINDDGLILIESIVPTLGEIFWWQQLEYKFPFIYSQETIEKTFNKNGLNLRAGYRDYGGYLGVKHRSYAEVKKWIFTWLMEYPMLLGYVIANAFKRPAIDHSFGHKMITQFWVKGEQSAGYYQNFKQGGENKSKTFGYNYNGYLKK